MSEHEARIQRYYDQDWDEDARITTLSVGGRVEFARVQQLVRASLAALGTGPLRVLDVGGGTGVHAAWLAGEGHDVLLVDPVASQVARAAQRPGVDARVGDARQLDFADGSFDAVLLFGPLYHLPTSDERLLALAEARRILRPGGVACAQGISRFAAFADRVFSVGMERLTDDDLDILRTGSWTASSSGFPGGHFHTGEELLDELTTAGFTEVSVQGVEGPQVGSMEYFVEDRAMEAAALVIAERSAAADVSRRRGDAMQVANLSAHISAVGRAPLA